MKMFGRKKKDEGTGIPGSDGSAQENPWVAGLGAVGPVAGLGAADPAAGAGAAGPVAGGGFPGAWGGGQVIDLRNQPGLRKQKILGDG